MFTAKLCKLIKLHGPKYKMAMFGQFPEKVASLYRSALRVGYTIVWSGIHEYISRETMV